LFACARKEFPEDVQVRHDADAVLDTEGLNGGRRKMANISRAQNVRIAVGSRVKDGVVIWIGQRHWLDDRRFDQVRSFSEIACEPLRLLSCYPVPYLNPRVEKYAFDLIENVPRQNQCVRFEHEIQ
jgi:hypothetical protein